MRVAPLKPLLVSSLVGALALAGCGSSDSGSSATTTSAAGADGSTTTTVKKSDLKVGLAFDIGGRGDKSFNDAAAAGLDKAKASLGVDAKDLSAKAGETDADKEERLKLLADGGYSPVIAVGFAYAKALTNVAPKYPNVKFAIVDDSSITAPNVTSLIFTEEQSSYLVGAIAALKSKTGTVGFVGGVQVPLIQKFEAGYTAGAKKVKPDIKVVSKYLTQPPDFTGFNAADKATLAATGMIDGGADVVYTAAGASGSGSFIAAANKGALSIGVDSDQYLSEKDEKAKSTIISSAIKKVDTAVFDFISSVADGSVKSGSVTFSLKNDGVGYSTSGGKIDDIAPQIEALKKEIIAGTIVVPTTL